MKLTRILALAATVPLAAFIINCGSSTGTGGTNPTPAPTPTDVPAGPRYFAPYVFTPVGADMVRMARTTGQPFFTLAFFVAEGGVALGTAQCRAAWDGQIDVDLGFYANQINTLRGLGGDVLVSFGGYGGRELAQACATPADLQTAYQAVIDQYGVTWLDFDIEGSQTNAIADTAANQRRDVALAAMQAANPNLKVNFTLPAGTGGLTAEGLALLTDAKKAGVKIEVVNAMTMDFGGPQADMGTTATVAAGAVATQIFQLGLTQTRMGITVMIGQNDTPGEIFTGADASTVLKYAQSHNLVELLSFWAANRDNGNCAGNTSAQIDCSGITQNEFDFMNVFKAFH